MFAEAFLRDRRDLIYKLTAVIIAAPSLPLVGSPFFHYFELFLAEPRVARRAGAASLGDGRRNERGKGTFGASQGDSWLI